MLTVILVSALLTGSLADNPKDDAQYMNLEVKGVKGGGGNYTDRGGDNLNRFFNHTQHGYVAASQTNHEIGICYTEVPTSSLASDPKHIPAGNGSSPGMSSIRTCCAGYIRNIHNYLICDPVCSKACVNALCTAPETCTCFPDHVKNLAGVCVATCPIGCQNGHCNGAQCQCKEGYKLDVSGRFCVPHCRDNCGANGTCIAPNTCGQPGSYPPQSVSQYPGSPVPGSQYPGSQVPGSQQPGSLGPGLPQPVPLDPGRFQSSGSLDPWSQHPYSPCRICIDDYCTEAQCACVSGYILHRGECIASCNPNCGPGKDCIAPNVCVPIRTGINSTQPQNNGNYNPNPLQTPYQNPNQYPHNQNQHPYPKVQNQSNPEHNQQHPNSYSHTEQSTPIYSPYPGQQNQNPGLQNQDPFPGQDNQHPHSNPSQPNGTNNYPNQYPQPGHQHMYPLLPSNNYPNTPQNQGTGSRTDGQVFYQNRPYNPLENATFNLQQGIDQTTSHSLNITQGHGQNVLGNQQGQISSDVFGNCQQPCINGNCVGRSKCECFSGYNQDPADTTGTRCIPYCHGGCLNGHCASPNNCVCSEGYQKDFSVKGRSGCVKRFRRSAQPVNVADVLVFEIPDKK